MKERIGPQAQKQGLLDMSNMTSLDDYVLGELRQQREGSIFCIRCFGSV